MTTSGRSNRDLFFPLWGIRRNDHPAAMLGFASVFFWRVDVAFLVLVELGSVGHAYI